MNKLILAFLFILVGTEKGLSLDNNYLAQIPTQQENKLTFECDNSKEYPMIMVKSKAEEPMIFLSWIPEYFPNRELALEQCQNTVQKLQSKEDEYGSLDMFQLSTAKINEQSIVCLVQKKERCTEEKLIFSLGNIEKPEEVLNKMLNRDLITENIRGGDFYLRSIPFRWLPF